MLMLWWQKTVQAIMQSSTVDLDNTPPSNFFSPANEEDKEKILEFLFFDLPSSQQIHDGSIQQINNNFLRENFVNQIKKLQQDVKIANLKKEKKNKHSKNDLPIDIAQEIPVTLKELWGGYVENFICESEEISIAFLIHGTTQTSAENIAQTGFILNSAQRIDEGFYGNGIYFTAEANTASKFATMRKGFPALILSAVAFSKLEIVAANLKNIEKFVGKNFSSLHIGRLATRFVKNYVDVITNNNQYSFLLTEIAISPHAAILPLFFVKLEPLVIENINNTLNKTFATKDFNYERYFRESTISELKVFLKNISLYWGEDTPNNICYFMLKYGGREMIFDKARFILQYGSIAIHYANFAFALHKIISENEKINIQNLKLLLSYFYTWHVFNKESNEIPFFQRFDLNFLDSYFSPYKNYLYKNINTGYMLPKLDENMTILLNMAKQAKAPDRKNVNEYCDTYQLEQEGLLKVIYIISKLGDALKLKVINFLKWHLEKEKIKTDREKMENERLCCDDNHLINKLLYFEKTKLKVN